MSELNSSNSPSKMLRVSQHQEKKTLSFTARQNYTTHKKIESLNEVLNSQSSKHKENLAIEKLLILQSFQSKNSCACTVFL